MEDESKGRDRLKDIIPGLVHMAEMIKGLSHSPIDTPNDTSIDYLNDLIKRSLIFGNSSSEHFGYT